MRRSDEQLRVCIVPTAYGKFSGEEAVVESTLKMPVEGGHKLSRSPDRKEL